MHCLNYETGLHPHFIQLVMDTWTPARKNPVWYKFWTAALNNKTDNSNDINKSEDYPEHAGETGVPYDLFCLAVTCDCNEYLGNERSYICIGVSVNIEYFQAHYGVGQWSRIHVAKESKKALMFHVVQACLIDSVVVGRSNRLRVCKVDKMTELDLFLIAFETQWVANNALIRSGSDNRTTMFSKALMSDVWF